ncbi:MAG TPA: DNA gyrase subunit A [Anaerolineae bacterium]|nr:DNA gyrase subunit A [Anaerolineae bacterium]
MEVGIVRRIDIDDEMQQSYLDYAMSVIVSRALPDARDGLKPVHRRILHAMHAMGIRPGADFKKSARIVGEVLGKYHPHGDMAVYDAMVRMAQDFSMRYPLVEGQGNFGSIDGDPPAAMRYTEARLELLAMDLLIDLDKDTVDFSANFDGSLQEPNVLPAAAPNLLINGATGIAVGMATSIPPHNLGEVCDALIFTLENWSKLEKISLDDLMKFIQGPDFPTGGIILRRKDESHGLINAYASGRGKITVQARSHIEEMGRGRSRIIVTQLPYQTNKSNLIERIAELAREGHLEGIADLRDESDRQGMRIVIELAKTAEPEKVLADLYRRTPMQSTFSIILLALVEGEPRLLNLRSALRVYLEHRLEVSRRRSQYDLDRARERAHVLEGLLVALENLDQVIEMIRTAKDVAQAQQRLQTRLKLSEQQAIAILDMRLRRLSSLERKKINREYREAQASIKKLESLLASPKKMRSLIATELLELKNRFADRRRTQVVEPGRGVQAAQLLTAQDVVPIKDTWIVLTDANLISRTPTARLPRLSGRKPPNWVAGAGTRDTLYIFSAQGQGAAVAVHTLPECDDPRQGKALASVAPLPADADVMAAISLPIDATSDQHKAGFLIFGTRSGMVKKTSISALPGPSAKSFLAIKLGDGDALQWVRFSDGSDDLLMISSACQAIRFSEDDVRPMGLAAAGVQGMRIDDPHAQVICVDIAHSGHDLFLLTQDGQAKRSAITQFPKQGRNGKGVLAWKSGEGINLIGAAVGKPDYRASAILSKAAARSLRFDDAPRRARTGSGKVIFEVKEGDRVTALKAVISRPEIKIKTKKPRKPTKTSK